MTMIRGALAALLLAAGIATPALAQTTTGTPAPGSAATSPPTIGAGAPGTQNPYVNPSAAGTQLSHTNQTSPSGPNVGQPAYGLQQSDRTRISAEDARKALEAKGYRSVAGLHKTPASYWEGTAMQGGRQVHVAVDSAGNVAEIR